METDCLSARGRKPRIVHVSADFPDPVEPAKTPVIRTLVDLASDGFDHRVLSINRRTPSLARFAASVARNPLKPHLDVSSAPFAHGECVIYAAPPRGLLHATMLRQLGDWLAARLAEGERPHLIVGHKLAFEGIAARQAAQRLGIPFAISIQGNSDVRALAARPDLHRELEHVFLDAAAVFPFAPWALRRLERRFGQRPSGTFLLPCPTDLDEPLPPVAGGRGLVTVFHLRNHKGKNLRRMADAARMLDAAGFDAPLAVIGGGSETHLAQCRSVIGNARAITLEGPLDRHPLRARLNGAAGFVMPSLRESFGLAFIEALFAGLPIIYPAGAAVDGYFDGAPFAVRVDARSTEAIAAAMRHVIAHQAELKAALARWQDSADARRFTRSAIGAQFSRGLATAVGCDLP